jgi:hypothetical protein
MKSMVFWGLTPYGSDRSSTFRRKILPTSSGLKSKPRKKLAEQTGQLSGNMI